MNLNDIVAPYIGAVNPSLPGKWYRSIGYTTDTDGGQLAQYAPAVAVSIQDQALTGRDLRQLDGLNIQGILRAFYVSAPIEGVNRPGQKGGDKFELQGKTWLVVQVLEPWADSAGWTKIAVALQVHGSGTGR